MTEGDTNESMAILQAQVIVLEGEIDQLRRKLADHGLL